jgi:hypothetical protein
MGFHHQGAAESSPMNPLYIGALVLLGACTGFAAGLLGIGGGMLLVPFLTVLFTWRGYPAEQIVHMAIATSLATILFTSVSSVRAHDQRGAVLWRVVWLLAPGILLGSLIGAQIAGRLPTFWRSSSQSSSVFRRCRFCAIASHARRASCRAAPACSALVASSGSFRA